MGMNWLQIPRAVLTLRSAVAPIGTTKDWWTSASIVYQLIVATVLCLTALGVNLVIPTDQIQEISLAVTVIAIAVSKLIDALIAIRLRVITTAPITGTVAAAKVADALADAPITTIVEVPVGSTVCETVQEIQLAASMTADMAKETPTTGTG